MTRSSANCRVSTRISEHRLGALVWAIDEAGPGAWSLAGGAGVGAAVGVLGSGCLGGSAKEAWPAWDRIQKRRARRFRGEDFQAAGF